MTSGKKYRILVTGATGQVGRLVIKLLASDPKIQVIAGARSVEKATDLGVPVVHLDYDDLDTLAPALKDIDGVFMVTAYTVDMLRQSKAFINAAKKAGVWHIVHLGAPGDDDTQIGHWGWHQFVERYIEWSGISFTHLRPELYMQNTLAYGGAKATDNGVIRHFIGNAKVSWVDCEDVAAVAAVALKNPDLHNGNTYRLGYDAKSYPEIANILSQSVGKTISYESRPPKEFLDSMKDVGADPAYMKCVYDNWIAYAERAIPGADATFDNFHELTGRAPRTWKDFSEKHREAFDY